MVEEIGGARREYGGEHLQAGDDPEAMFTDWLKTADSQLGQDARAMTLATTHVDGAPDARIVLLRRWQEGRLCFFGGGRSAKGAALAARPEAALVFFWPQLDRQVRIQGRVSVLPQAEIDAYFSSRPGPNRLAAGLAVQSEPLPKDWDELHRRYQAALPDAEAAQRPEDWLGWQVTPYRWEFWQGQASRLNQRLQFTRSQNSQPWYPTWLAP
jgi:pyridoxamine 5'-phosphate oxidase